MIRGIKETCLYVKDLRRTRAFYEKILDFEVIAEVEKLVEDEYKEITLLGQIINKYQVKVDNTLIKFLEDTLKKHNA